MKTSQVTVAETWQCKVSGGSSKPKAPRSAVAAPRPPLLLAPTATASAGVGVPVSASTAAICASATAIPNSQSVTANRHAANGGQNVSGTPLNGAFSLEKRPATESHSCLGTNETNTQHFHTSAMLGWPTSQDYGQARPTEGRRFDSQSKETVAFFLVPCVRDLRGNKAGSPSRDSSKGRWFYWI